MKRRDFLKVLGFVPAVLAVPAVVVAKAIVPVKGEDFLREGYAIGPCKMELFDGQCRYDGAKLGIPGNPYEGKTLEDCKAKFDNVRNCRHDKLDCRCEPYVPGDDVLRWPDLDPGVDWFSQLVYPEGMTGPKVWWSPISEERVVHEGRTTFHYSADVSIEISGDYVEKKGEMLGIWTGKHPLVVFKEPYIFHFPNVKGIPQHASWDVEVETEVNEPPRFEEFGLSIRRKTHTIKLEGIGLAPFGNVPPKLSFTWLHGEE